jgi:hypothetical protein
MRGGGATPHRRYRFGVASERVGDSSKTLARDEQRASGDELHPRALSPECDRQSGGDAVAACVEERID